MNRTPEQPQRPNSGGLERKVVGMLLDYAREHSPQHFAAFLCGGIVANVVANLPEDYWQEFSKVKPCNQPGCDCHVLKERLMPALTVIRNDHIATMRTKAGGN